MRARLLVLALVPFPAFGQTDDRGYLTALLEDNLSGVGRQVVISGFSGALSSQARIAELTISDDVGIWLTLRDVVLDWNRAALFSGNLSVNQLSAAEIIVARMPILAEDAPAPEAGEFSLPELPVSVKIGKLAAAQISLGPDVLGQPVEGRLEASMSLVGGEGTADLVLERVDDGPDGRITLTASYSNLLDRLSLDLSAVEGAGGIASTSLGLPGAPSASLEISGEGPFSDFSADIALATDGVDRLAGTVAVKAETDTIQGFTANLAGDLAPLFLPAYATFFGDRVSLVAKGQSHADGRLDLSTFDVSAKAITLSGALELGADRQPRSFDLTGRIAQADGTAVLLPLTSELPVQIQSADIRLRYDQSQSDAWTGQASILGFDRADFRASRLALSGSGRIAPSVFGASLRFDAEGLEPTNRALSDALGSVVSGDAVLFWRADKPGVALPKARLIGEDYAASITGARVLGLSEGFALTGKIAAEMADLSRLSGLAGQPLGGAAKLDLAGKAEPLTGAFDLRLAAQGTDMTVGILEIDGVLRGPSTVSADVVRDSSGTLLRSLTVAAKGLTADVSGKLASLGSDLGGTVTLADLSVLRKGFGGRVSGDARFVGTLENGRITFQATGQGLRAGQNEVDRLLKGESRLEADLALKDGKILVDRAQILNPQVTLTATGQIDGGAQALDVTGRLQNLGVLLPEFPGPLTLSGKVVQDAAGSMIDLAGRGPGGIDATVSGRLTPGFERANLQINGRAQAALANPFVAPRAVSGGVGFNLSLNGPIALSSLAGTISLDQGRLADPGQPFAFQGFDARAVLGGGQAQVTGTLPVSTGGAVALSGTIGLSEPHNAALGLGLQQVILRDPDLFQTKVSGELKVVGPILGGARITGRLELAETELRVPSTGFGSAGGLPDLAHRHEPADVRATRARAGLLAAVAKAGRSSAAVYGLDVTITAPRRVFIRGRGLDAELGGELRLLGTTADVRPSGAFNLVRGRLDILGKRLDLDEALLQIEGELVPDLRIRASTENDGVIASVLIDGPANDPKVNFTSIPDLPEEEVLAQLLFGQGLQNLSALQALQLANAVATLAGRGGEGVVSRLRQGFGLDNLDVKTTAEGGAEVTAGKYIGKNAYTEITVDQDGKSQINLNLDVTDSLILRGRAGSDGDTGIGIFLEKDY